MEQNKFFKWTQRINSILFLLLLVLSIGFLTFMIFESNKWGERNTVEVVDKKNNEEPEKLRLSQITKVCGQDIQYVELNTPRNSKGFSSGGYGSNTRNVIFFVGQEMRSHWLFQENTYLITEIRQLKVKSDKCKNKEAVAIYYEIIKEDSNNDGKLDKKDAVTIALTSPNGQKYIEVESGITSVLDSDTNDTASILTLLVQENNKILMKKYSLRNSKKISEKEITRIGKS